MAAAPQSDQDRLAAAIAARDALIRGEKAVKVVVNGYQAEFVPANREALESYIAELQATIAGRNVRGAVGIIF